MRTSCRQSAEHGELENGRHIREGESLKGSEHGWVNHDSASRVSIRHKASVSRTSSTERTTA